MKEILNSRKAELGFGAMKQSACREERVSLFDGSLAQCVAPLPPTAGPPTAPSAPASARVVCG